MQSKMWEINYYINFGEFKFYKLDFYNNLENLVTNSDEKAAIDFIFKSKTVL